MLRRCCGAARYIYNWGLAEWKAWYERGDKPSRYKLCKHFNAVKDDICPWVRELPYAVTESAFANLGLAFDNFFRRVKNGEEKAGYPKFKKRGRVNSFQLRGTKIKHDRVRLTGVGWVRLKERGYIPTEGTYGIYATVSEIAGRWFISVLVKDNEEQPQNNGDKIIGVDFGLTHLAVCSDGTIFENPAALRQALRRLSRLNRELSRRKKGGKNWVKTKRKLQRAHAKVANIRRHALHQASYSLVFEKRPTLIVLENLNVSGMMKNRHLARAISDVGFYEMRRQIEYKAAWAGTEIAIASRWFPSSKTCSNCGCVKDALSLGDRVFICEHCGFEIDRDLNAAMNLAAFGRNTAVKRTVDACGVEV